MTEGVSEEERIASELTGNTLLVYWCVLRKGRGHPIGVREVQRMLGFSSPSTAVYHLDKLTELNLLKRDRTGSYVVNKRIKVGLMNAFFSLGKFVIPKHSIYAIIMTLITAFFFFQFPNAQIALLPSLLACAIFWYEALVVWRRKPKFYG